MDHPNEEDIAASLASLRQVRAEKREAAILLANLLEKAYPQLRDFLAVHDIIDPITRDPLLRIEWTPLDPRGASLSVTAIDEAFGFALEVHYEHGGVLATGTRSNSENAAEDFNDRIFRGTPLRLEDRDGVIYIIRRVPGDREAAFPVTVLLSTFAEAVKLRYTHHL